jgi:hypothetical protein
MITCVVQVSWLGRAGVGESEAVIIIAYTVHLPSSQFMAQIPIDLYPEILTPNPLLQQTNPV